eukprot:9495075-Pyramimonas_sp.AAC.1
MLEIRLVLQLGHAQLQEVGPRGLAFSRSGSRKCCCLSTFLFQDQLTLLRPAPWLRARTSASFAA